MTTKDLDKDARELRRQAEDLTQATNTKIDAYKRQARRLTWVTIAIGILILAVGVVAIYGVRVSAGNNHLLHESEYAFCAAGLPPPAIANTPTCKRAQAQQAAKTAGQVGPFADVICQKVVRALGGNPSRCAKTPTPTKTVVRVLPGPIRTVVVTKCVRPSGRPC